MLIPAAKGAVRAEGDEQVKTQDCWWEHDGKGHHRFSQEFPAPPREGHPQRNRDAYNYENERGQAGEFSSQYERLPIHLLTGLLTMSFKAVFAQNLLSGRREQEFHKAVRRLLVLR